MLASLLAMPLQGLPLKEVQGRPLEEMQGRPLEEMQGRLVASIMQRIGETLYTTLSSNPAKPRILHIFFYISRGLNF